MKKFVKFIFALLIAIMFSTAVFATSANVASGDATMSLVEDNVCDITFGEYGTFEKKLVKCDTDNKTVDISLTATNNQDAMAEKAGEVVLLVDNSNSIKTESVTLSDGTTTTRQKLILSSAQTLVDKLFASNTSIKIGVVEFATSPTVANEGTSEDAKTLTSTLSNDKTTVTNALTSINTDTMGPRTDIEEGLKAADALLSASTSTTKKYIIVLTDAIPNTATGVTFDTYSDKTATPTKDELLTLKNKGINIISMLVNMSDDEISASLETPKPTYKQVAQKIFGTTSNPTAGSVYYVTDNDVSTTILSNIYNELIPSNDEYSLTNIIIKDYFPQNIIDNFDFSYLIQPTIGKVSAKVDTSDNSITWTISELKPQETATFTYRLTLKNTISSDIVGINLPTNKNVTIDYEENEKDWPQKQNDKCPIIALDVQATKEVPQTGNTTIYTISGLVATALVIGIASYINIRKNKIN